MTDYTEMQSVLDNLRFNRDMKGYIGTLDFLVHHSFKGLAKFPDHENRDATVMTAGCRLGVNSYLVDRFNEAQ